MDYGYARVSTDDRTKHKAIPRWPIVLCSLVIAAGTWHAMFMKESFDILAAWFAAGLFVAWAEDIVHGKDR